MLKPILILFAIYLAGQLLYSGYYYFRSKKLVGTTYLNSASLGSGPPLRLFVTGDSLGAGIGASSFETSLAGRVALALADKHQVSVQNFSRSGARIKHLLDVPTPTNHQTVILLIISSNDLLHATNLNTFHSTTDQVLQKFSPLADRVVVIGPGNVGNSDLIPLVAWPYYRWRRPQYVKILRQSASRLPNVTYISPVDQPPSFTSKYNRATTSTDHFHLNDEGYRWWADLVIKALN